MQPAYIGKCSFDFSVRIDFPERNIYTRSNSCLHQGCQVCALIGSQCRNKGSGVYVQSNLRCHLTTVLRAPRGPLQNMEVCEWKDENNIDSVLQLLKAL